MLSELAHLRDAHGFTDEEIERFIKEGEDFVRIWHDGSHNVRIGTITDTTPLLGNGQVYG